MSTSDIAKIRTILSEFAISWQSLLGEKLIGAYVSGSFCMDSFQIDLSDLDVIAVISSPMETSVGVDLATLVFSQGKQVPAEGLEFVVITEESAKSPNNQFELSISCGPRWHDEMEYRGIEDSLSIETTICHQKGIALVGPPSAAVFSPASHEQLALAITSNLEWHRHHICDKIHDPGGQNAVLNACRAWRFAIEGVLDSKLGGAIWAIENGADRELITGAVALRQQDGRVPLEPDAVDQFLIKVLSHFDKITPGLS